MKILRSFFIFFAITSILGGVLTVSSSQPVYAAAVDCNRGFLGFPAWFRGLTEGPDCNLKDVLSFNTADTTNPDVSKRQENNGLANFIWRVALNVIEIGMMAVAYIASGLILFGGFQYLTSAGSVDVAKKARTTITNAAIGLVISIAAVAIVNVIFGIIT